MFSRKLQNTNLKIFSAKAYSGNSEFTKSTVLLQALRDMANVRVKMKIQEFGPIRMLRNKYFKVQPAVKEESRRCLRIWAHQCECVLAQRLRRCQQMFCVYSKLWEERAFLDLIRSMRNQLHRHGKQVLLGAVGVTAFNWEANRITNTEIEKHMDEFDYVRTLIDKTITCPKDKCNGQPNRSLIPFCKCPERGSAKRIHEDWITFTEGEDIVVWRKLHSSGNYEYKVYGSYNDVTGEDFLNVQIDCTYRKKWDSTAIALDVVESDPKPHSNSDIIYWEMLWPVSKMFDKFLSCVFPQSLNFKMLQFFVMFLKQFYIETTVA